MLKKLIVNLQNLSARSRAQELFILHSAYTAAGEALVT